MKLFLAAIPFLAISSLSFAKQSYSGLPIGHMRHDCEVKGKDGKSYEVGTLNKEMCVNALGGNYIEFSRSRVAGEGKQDKSGLSH